MADNTRLNAGINGDLIAADDIGGVKFQRVKMIIGADGVNNGDVSAANPMPVTATVPMNVNLSTVTPQAPLNVVMPGVTNGQPLPVNLPGITINSQLPVHDYSITAQAPLPVYLPGVAAGVPLNVAIPTVTPVNRSGTITTTDVAQQLAPANANRKRIRISNESDGVLWFSDITTAVVGSPSQRLNPWETYTCEAPCSGLAISIIGTAGQAWSAQEY